MLSDNNINEFQKIYKDIFHKEISPEEAFKQGSSLVRLIELIFKPISESEYKKLQGRRSETKDL